MALHQIILKPSWVARVLGAVAYLLVLAGIGGRLIAHRSVDAHLHWLVWLFDLNADKNIPAIFSTFLLLFAALLLAAIAVLERVKPGSSAWYWVVLSIGFFYMALDEALVYHERLIKPMRLYLGDGPYGLFYFSWVIPYLAMIVLLAPFFLRFLFRLPKKTRTVFQAAAVLYVGGAIGLELIEGRFVELHGALNLTYSMLIVVEESLEMGGVILFIWALLVFIADHYGEVRVRFEGADLQGPS